jgi:hypothetical protein
MKAQGSRLKAEGSNLKSESKDLTMVLKKRIPSPLVGEGEG